MRTCLIFVFSLVIRTYVGVPFTLPTQSSSQDTNHNDDSYDNDNYAVCTTQHCTDVASRISTYLNRTIDPCENFYQFACGGWMKDHPANTSYPLITTMMAIKERTEEQIKEILESEAKPDDTLSLGKARELYAMCVDIDKRKLVGISGLRELVQKNGGWPMSLPNWEEEGNTWQQISDVISNDTFYNGLYDIAVTVDHKKSDSHIINIVEPFFFVPRSIMISIGQNPDLKTFYTSYIEKHARIFMNDAGDNHIENTTLTQDANDLVDFEIELANLTMTPEDSRDIDKIYKELTIEELQQTYDEQQSSSKSKIDWLLVLRGIFAPLEITIESSEKLVVRAHKFLINLVPLLEQTPTRTIVNYIQWTFIRSLLKYSIIQPDMAAFNIAKHFQSQATAQDVKLENCVDMPNLDTTISHAYAKKYVNYGKMEHINDVITDIKGVIRNQISTSTWMDETTKEASLEKLDSMRSEIGIPDWYSDIAIDEYYDKLEIKSGYLESVASLLKFENKKKLLKLRKPVAKAEWRVQPTTITALHYFSGNVITVTDAILQDPIYDKNNPAFMNYGSLGFVIGHEVNHGFDDIGRKYDKDGNSIQWWTQPTIDKYKSLTECFVSQYNDYQVPGLENSNETINVNGRLSLGENIGDSAAIVAAYKAYKSREADTSQPELRLPGLEKYNDDQMFFISAAHTFCESITLEKTVLLLSDVHPRAETRIRGSFSNFDEFSSVYNCPIGSGMNPEDKCAFWQ